MTRRLPTKGSRKGVGGRPSKYNAGLFPAQALVACAEMGADNVKLAKLFGVSVSTVDRWQRQHPEFRRAIKRGKEDYDARNVEARLLDRCLGYEYEVTKEQTLPNGNTKVTVMRKHMPPDVTACIFWLCNRNPDRWRRIKETHIHGEVVHGHLHAHGGAVEIRDSAADVAEVARILREAGALDLDGAIEEIRGADEA